MEKKDIPPATTTTTLDPELAMLIKRYQEGHVADCDRNIGMVIIIPRNRLDITQQALERYTTDLILAGSKSQQPPAETEKDTGACDNTADTTGINTTTNPENEKIGNDSPTMHYSVHYLDPQKPEDGILYIVADPTVKEAAAIAELPWVARLERPQKFHAELKG